MQFLAFLLVFLLINWLGWWLLYISIGLAIALVLLLWWEGSTKFNNYKVPGVTIEVDQNPGYSILNIRTDINSGESGRGKGGSPPAMSSNRALDCHGPVVALVITDGPLEQILSGRKTWEMRAQHTRKRERIALAKKGSGMIYGVAEIVDSRGPLSIETMHASTSMHGIDPSRIDQPEMAKYRYAWVLTNVRILRQPVPYLHTKGAQSFVKLDGVTSGAIRFQLGES